MRRGICLVVFLLFCSVARAEDFSFIWLTYAQWERLSADDRAAYLAGAFDSLTGFGNGGAGRVADAFDSLMGFANADAGRKVAVHYSKCMRNAGMSLGQFSEKVLAFGLSRPDLQGTTVQRVLINYLIGLCGTPPL